MAKRIISFVDGAELPFLVDPYPEIPDDFDGDAGDPPEPDHAAMLAKMRRAIPRDAVYLGVIGENLNGQPGSCWRVEDHFYLVPVRDRKFEWALVRITWDDDESRYNWADDAFGAGLGDAQAAGVALVKAAFKHWQVDLSDPEFEAQREFLQRISGSPPGRR